MRGLSVTWMAAVFTLLAAALLVAGVWMIYEPAALIVAAVVSGVAAVGSVEVGDRK